MRRFVGPLLFALVPALLVGTGLSCASPAPEEPVGFAVRWGLGEPSVLPAAVTNIILYICYEDEEECDRNQCSVAALTGEVESGGSCRPAEGTEGFMDRPVLVRRDLRTDVPVSFTVVGADSGGAYRFLGQAGPMVLGEGHRRQVELFMYPVGTSSLVDAELPRLLPTTSLLPDGRVLIAGGFETATEGECPAERMLPMGSRCYSLVASDEAAVFDLTTRTVTPIRNAMLEARGGHSATVMPDGRVLIAGGAPRALVAFSPEGTEDSGRYLIQFFPQGADGSDGAHASFELFDAYLDPEAEDADRDGDPGRGRFLGTSGTASAGALNAPRFLHAAAAVPMTPSQVVLAGGLGGGEETFEVFDGQKAGGFGVYPGAGPLSSPRGMPGAVGIGDTVWIVGGRFAESNAELAEIWSSGGTGMGSVTAASEATEFPNVSAGMVQDEPRFSLLRPNVVAVDDGARPLVVGWYGPQCMSGSMSPVFFDQAIPTELCNQPGTGSRTSFTVSPTGVTTPSNPTPRAFGATAHLWRRPVPDVPFSSGPSGEIAFTGGIANVAFSGQATVEIFTGGVSSTGEAITDSSLAVSVMAQRFLHASSGTPGGAIVTVGGASFDSLRGLTLVPSVEVAYVPPGR